MKGDFAKAYNAGRQAYQEQQSSKGQSFNIWDSVFTVLIALVALASLEQHWLPWYLIVLILAVAVLSYGVIKAVLQRKKHQQKDKTP